MCLTAWVTEQVWVTLRQQGPQQRDTRATARFSREPEWCSLSSGQGEAGEGSPVMGRHQRSRCRIHEGTGEPRTVLREHPSSQNSHDPLLPAGPPPARTQKPKAAPWDRKVEKRKRPMNRSDLGDCRRYHFKPSVKFGY